jgi:dihydrofolate reductase
MKGSSGTRAKIYGERLDRLAEDVTGRAGVTASDCRYAARGGRKPDGTLWDAFGWPAEMQEFMNDVFRRADTAVYGRGTYDAIVPWWDNVAKGNFPADVVITEREIEFANILQGITKVVFSRTINDESTDVLVLNDDAVRNVAALKERAGGDIVLHGGSGLVGQLAEADLIDEYMLFVSPAAIRKGKPRVKRELSLSLFEARVFNSAFVLLRYEPAQRARS